MAKRLDNKGRVLPPHVSQRSNGTYIIRFVSKSGAKICLYAKTLEEAKEKCANAIADTNRGVVAKIDVSTTLEDAVEKMLEDKKLTIKIATKNNYDRVFTKHIKGTTLGRRKLSDVTQSDVKKHLLTLATKKGLSYGTIQLVKSVLKSACDIAVNDGALYRNPCNGVMKEIKKACKPTERKEALTQEEQSAFLNFVKGSNCYKRYYPFFVVLFGSGLRHGEATGLRRCDISIKNGTIDVNHCVVYLKENGAFKFLVSTPKTENGFRVVDMVPGVQKAFKEQIEYLTAHNLPRDFEIVADNGERYSDFLFVTKEGKPFSTGFTEQLIKRIVKQYNKAEEAQALTEGRRPKPLRNFSAHICRHSFATRFVENSNAFDVLQKEMGHSDYNFTLNRYCDTQTQRRRAVMESIGDRIMA